MEGVDDYLAHLYETGRIGEEALFELSDGRAEDDYQQPEQLHENQPEHQRD